VSECPNRRDRPGSRGGRSECYTLLRRAYRHSSGYVGLDRIESLAFYETITTGAESDLEQLTEIARQMVGRWGMSDKLGARTLLPRDDEAASFAGAAPISPQTQHLIEEEAQTNRGRGPRRGHTPPDQPPRAT
jgi:ATP-dependent Zn protease